MTVKEVDEKFLEPIPADRFELLGVKLEEEPYLLDLKLEFDEEHRATMSLVTMGPSLSPQKKIPLDTTLPFRLIPDALMSIKDILAEECDAEALVENAMAVLLKRVVRVRFDRIYHGQDDIEITVFVSSFESRATCPIRYLDGFISPEDTETLAEWEARHEPAVE